MICGSRQISSPSRHAASLRSLTGVDGGNLTTKSISLFGKYNRVEKLPNTKTCASGHFSFTATRIRCTKYSLNLISICVGSKYCIKHVTSRCNLK